ncbi:50S ribosomal protein L23 [Buchnera aphidicola (Eriosoma grossulariae)]|uniref:50S ribosomal protein L23 n=1 Tax=Buchnera aphidicola TaxID=9 RepID=UPI003A5E0AAA
MSEKNLFKILISPHISEKSAVLIEKKNTVVLKVQKNVNKYDIKIAIQKLFNVKVKNINTLIVKGKNKRHKNYIVYGHQWKKAYVTLHHGENLDFIGTRNK